MISDYQFQNIPGKGKTKNTSFLLGFRIRSQLVETIGGYNFGTEEAFKGGIEGYTEGNDETETDEME